jgi:hypothetical protein
VTEVARRNQVSRETVHRWLRRYAEGEGLAGLADRSSRGRVRVRCPRRPEARVVALRLRQPKGEVALQSPDGPAEPGHPIGRPGFGEDMGALLGDERIHGELAIWRGRKREVLQLCGLRVIELACPYGFSSAALRLGGKPTVGRRGLRCPRLGHHRVVGPLVGSSWRA